MEAFGIFAVNVGAWMMPRTRWDADAAVSAICDLGKLDRKINAR